MPTQLGIKSLGQDVTIIIANYYRHSDCDLVHPEISVQFIWIQVVIWVSDPEASEKDEKSARPCLFFRGFLSRKTQLKLFDGSREDGRGCRSSAEAYVSVRRRIQLRPRLDEMAKSRVFRSRHDRLIVGLQSCRRLGR